MPETYNNQFSKTDPMFQLNNKANKQIITDELNFRYFELRTGVKRKGGGGRNTPSHQVDGKILNTIRQNMDLDRKEKKENS